MKIRLTIVYIVFLRRHELIRHVRRALNTGIIYYFRRNHADFA